MIVRKVLIADFENADVGGHLPFFFKKAGWTVEVFCSATSWLLKNKNWDVWHTSSATPQEYAKTLEEHVIHGNYDWVVLADDTTLRIANEYIQDEHRACQILPISDLKNRMLLGSKAGFSLLCEQYGITTPRFVVFDETVPITTLLERVPFPLVTKIDHSAAGKGIKYCKDITALLETIEKIPPKLRHNLVLQEYIDGDTISVEALYKKGRLLAYMYSKVLKTVSSEFSVSVTREYYSYEAIEPFLQIIGEQLSIDGFSSITLKCDAKGVHHLIEVDLRIHSWFFGARCVGVDFSEAITNYVNDTRVLLRPTLKKEERVMVRNFPRDFLWNLQNFELIGILKWIFNIHGTWKFIPHYDSRVLIATSINIIQLYIKWLWQRVRSGIRRHF